MHPFTAVFLSAATATLILSTSPPAAADPVPDTIEAVDVGTTIAPRLLISVTNGRGQLIEGTSVTYTLTVRNEGSGTYPDVVVSQVLPHGVRLRSATAGYDARPGQLAWHVLLRAGEQRVFTVTGDVTDTGSAARSAGARVATACVAPAPARPLSSCASDSDAYRPAPARAAWAAAATATLTGIVVAGSATLLRLRTTMTRNGGKARRWRLS